MDWCPPGLIKLWLRLFLLQPCSPVLPPSHSLAFGTPAPQRPKDLAPGPASFSPSSSPFLALPSVLFHPAPRPVPSAHLSLANTLSLFFCCTWPAKRQPSSYPRLHLGAGKLLQPQGCDPSNGIVSDPQLTCPHPLMLPLCVHGQRSPRIPCSPHGLALLPSFCTDHSCRSLVSLVLRPTAECSMASRDFSTGFAHLPGAFLPP